jgi:DNA-binding NarL/FixJ family response regulator
MQPKPGTGQGQKKPIKILLVDDHAIVREGIAGLVDHQPDMEVVAAVEDAPAALNEIARTKPTLVIVDLTLRKGDGFELIRALRAQHPSIRVLVLTMQDENLYAVSAVRAGALGYVMKDHAPNILMDAIHQVWNRRIYLSPDLMNALVCGQLSAASDQPQAAKESLTDRERQILLLISQWRRPRQIARDLNISIKTVDYYRARLKEKLHLDSAAHLTQYAIEMCSQDPSTKSLQAAEQSRKRRRITH